MPLVIHRLKQAFKCVLIGWGAYSLAAHAGTWLLRQTLPGAEPPIAVEIIPSPDGLHLLELAYASGGGALAPDCHDLVTMKSLDARGRIVAEEQLYSAPCSASGVLSAAWTDDRIAITAAQHGGAHRITYRNVTSAGLPVTFALH